MACLTSALIPILPPPQYQFFKPPRNFPIQGSWPILFVSTEDTPPHPTQIFQVQFKCNLLSLSKPLFLKQASLTQHAIFM